MKPFKNYAEKRFYQSWADMKYRCTNKNCKKYYLYGKRGITYSKEWGSFETFYKDMWETYITHAEQHKYIDKNGKLRYNTSLDRIDVNGNYSKENCRWATAQEQRMNVRNKAIYKAKNLETGKEYIVTNMAEFCKKYNFHRQKVFTVLAGKRKTYHGWEFKRLTKTER